VINHSPQESAAQETQSAGKEAPLSQNDDSSSPLSVLKVEVRALSNVTGGGVIVTD
jgi:hypothetical protein